MATYIDRGLTMHSINTSLLSNFFNVKHVTINVSGHGVSRNYVAEVAVKEQMSCLLKLNHPTAVIFSQK